MKLLFDANLSPELARLLNDIFPGSRHVLDFGNLTADDIDIWNFAVTEQFIIVTKDSDFNELNQRFSGGPKVVWIRRGNCPTSAIEHILRSHEKEIIALGHAKDDIVLLVLY
jgi:predicted nuclease of predicted toxin-antitoxin system